LNDQAPSEEHARTLEGRILRAAFELSRETGKPIRQSLNVVAEALAAEFDWRIVDTLEGPRVVVDRARWRGE
jgi:hypothetical protein